MSRKRKTNAKTPPASKPQEETAASGKAAMAAISNPASAGEPAGGGHDAVQPGSQAPEPSAPGADDHAAAGDGTVLEGGDDEQGQQVSHADAEGAAASGLRDPDGEEPQDGAPAGGGEGSAAAGSRLNGDRCCRYCGCTQNAACLDENGPCYWIASDVCSGCRDKLRADMNVIHATWAGGLAYGAPRALEHARLDVDYVDVGAMMGEATGAMKEAGAFVRANPAAPMEAIPIHLELQGFAAPVRDRRALLAWSVFAFTLKALDAADGEDAAERAAAARVETERVRRRAMPRDRLAMAPPDNNPLTQIARANQRRK